MKIALQLHEYQWRGQSNRQFVLVTANIQLSWKGRDKPIVGPKSNAARIINRARIATFTQAMERALSMSQARSICFQLLNIDK